MPRRTATTLAKQREADGEPDPLNVQFWGVGNESWGCGGNFTPEDYATEFRRFTAWVPGYGVPLKLVGSGPNGDDYDWTRRFFAKMAEGDKPAGRMWGWALHYYCGTAGQGQAVDFNESDWYELLEKAVQMARRWTRLITERTKSPCNLQRYILQGCIAGPRADRVICPLLHK